MAVPKLALAALGVTAVAAVAATRKPKAKSKTKKPASRVQGFKSEPTSASDHPICRKYPQGNWTGDGYVTGYPKGKSGWNKEDRAMVRAAVDEELAAAPAWTSMSEARKTSFEMTRAVVKRFCPSAQLPKSPINIESYLKKSLGLRWMWSKVSELIWNDYVMNSVK